MWPRIGNALLGVWLMIAPALLSYEYPASQNDRIVGPIAATIAVVAIAQVMRPLRWLNLAAGLWLVVAPFALDYDVTRAIMNDVLVGAAMIVLAQIRGPITDRFGGGWSALLPSDWNEECPPEADESAVETHAHLTHETSD